MCGEGQGVCGREGLRAQPVLPCPNHSQTMSWNEPNQVLPVQTSLSGVVGTGMKVCVRACVCVCVYV